MPMPVYLCPPPLKYPYPTQTKKGLPSKQQQKTKSDRLGFCFNEEELDHSELTKETSY